METSVVIQWSDEWIDILYEEWQISVPVGQMQKAVQLFEFASSKKITHELLLYCDVFHQRFCYWFILLNTNFATGPPTNSIYDLSF